MKRIALFCFLTVSLLFLTNCSSETPANVENRNANAAPPTANVSTPITEKSPAAGDEKLADANFEEIARQIHEGVNEFRREQGLQPLALNPVISEQARAHSVDMSQSPNTISHEDFQKRVEQLREKLPFQTVGENVAANKNYANPGVEAVEGWKQSPKHRENMLGDFNQTGIGVARAAGGGYFFTQIFWKP